MSCNHPDYKNYFRSGVALVVGLPLSLAAFSFVGTATDLARRAASNPALEAQEVLEAELTRPCLVWSATEVDSKLERQAKDEIDAVFGDVGGIDYGSLCKWVLS